MNWTFFDCETTGPDPSADRLTQIAIVSADLSQRFETLVNPGRPIPPAIQELTKITDQMVVLAPPFETIAQDVADRLAGRILVGFGCHKFDVPLLDAEFERVGVAFDWSTVSVIDAGELFKIHEPRNLDAALRHYCGRPLVDAHSAMADAQATRDVFLSMVGRYPTTCNLSGFELEILSRHGKAMADPAGKLSVIDGRLCFNTHRNRGVAVLDDVSYAEWILRSDFPRSTKLLIRKELKAVEVPIGDEELEWGEDDQAQLFE